MFQKAKEHLKKYGMDGLVSEFDVSSATVGEAAIAVGVSEGEIAKTLSFIVDEKPILIVVAGDVKIDNAKYKVKFHAKAKMIPFENVEELIGHAVGGVCPFGINDGVTVYLDDSLKRYEIVYPACGSSNSAVKMTIAQLEKASEFTEWVDVCKSII